MSSVAMRTSPLRRLLAPRLGAHHSRVESDLRPLSIVDVTSLSHRLSMGLDSRHRSSHHPIVYRWERPGVQTN